MEIQSPFYPLFSHPIAHVRYDSHWLYGQNSIFGLFFFPVRVLVYGLWELRDKGILIMTAILSRKPQSHVKMLIYRTRATGIYFLVGLVTVVIVSLIVSAFLFSFRFTTRETNVG